jgi:hypothetical protein
MLEHPYGNEEETFVIDQMTVENRLDRVQLYGSVEITKDKIGLKRARELKALLDRVVEALEADELPEAVAIEKTDSVENPFL